MVELSIQQEIINLLKEFPDRSLAEIRGCMPQKIAPQTKATLDSLEISRVVTRRIDRYKTNRYSIRNSQFTP